MADPQEILIMDTTDVNTAREVWRWNAGGLGFSSTGYNGTYELAMTNNGTIVADRMTTGTLRAINIIGVSISGSTFETAGDRGKILISGGEIKFQDRTGKEFGRFYPSNVGNDSLTMSMASTGGMIFQAGEGLLKKTMFQLGKGYAADAPVTTLTGEQVALWFHYTNGQTVRSGVEISNDGVNLRGGTKIDSKLEVGNNAAINFYSPLDMHGYSIRNQSDIRLKENIENSSIDGIKETKNLEFVEFNRRLNYQTKQSDKQPSDKRELGLVAQYSPFLSVEGEKDHYLRIDTSKQIMLNSLTNKQLIEKVERLEEQLNSTKKNKRKYHRGGI